MLVKKATQNEQTTPCLVTVILQERGTFHRVEILEGSIESKHKINMQKKTRKNCKKSVSQIKCPLYRLVKRNFIGLLWVKEHLIQASFLILLLCNATKNNHREYATVSYTPYKLIVHEQNVF